jgi:hypothetical protein
MADAAYWDHTSTLARWTRALLRKYATKCIGEVVGDVAAVDSELLNLEINFEVEEWRSALPAGFKGIGERETTLTFDPTAVDTRIELPADFAEFLSGGRAYLVDSDGDTQDPLEIISKQEWEDRYGDGDNYYDDRDTPLGVLFGLSENGTRFLEIRPTPTETIYIKLPYHARLASLDLDADEIEAPHDTHRGIAYGVAVAYLDMKGFGEQARVFAAKKNRILQRLQGKVVENPRITRFRSYYEADGDRRVTYPLR